MCVKKLTLLTALLLSPTVTITSTNIQLFYYVFYDGTYLIACVIVWPAIHCYSFLMYFLFLF